MAITPRPGRHDRRSLTKGPPACLPPKLKRKTKKQERLERAIELRAFALKFLGEHGRWTTLPPDGLEVLCFEDPNFQIGFYVRRQVPKALRERFHLAPLQHGLYNLDVWNLQGEPRGKVLNLNWLTVGAVPSITTFKRGDWEWWLLRVS
jgi:hypothetical protein